MRTKFTLFAVCLMLFAVARSATIIVNVINNQFIPANIPNVQVGDIIRFTFMQGFHNATSIDVPEAILVGAAVINSGAPSGSNPRTYDYTPTVPGIYKYICEVHADATTFTGMVGQFTVQGVLPATLKEFNVVANNKKPEISWKTLLEINVSYFSLRTSTDGLNFKEVGRVQAAGNSVNEQSYAYTDLNVLPSRYVYYMLAIVDKDGREKFSEMKTFRNTLASAALVARMSPNPVPRHSQLMLQFNAEKAGQLIARIFNAQGKFVMQARMSAFAGLNNGHLHAGDLPVGNYTAEFMLDGVKEVKKIVVQ